MSFSMTIICLMLFITICVLSSAMSMKNSLTSNLNKLALADIELTKKRNITDGSLYSKEKQADGKISLIESLNHLDFDVDANFKDVVDFSIYTTNEVTLKDNLGDYYADTAKEKYPLLLYDKVESLIQISDYNKIAKIFYLKTYSLADDEYIVVANYKELSGVKDEGLAYKPKIDIHGKEYHPKYLNCMDGF